MRESAPSKPASTEPSVLDVEPGLFWYGMWKNLSIAVWEKAATRDAVLRLDRTTPARLKLHPRLSTVHIATPTAGVPDGAARAAFGDTAKRWGHITGCVSVVVEHRGFAASALRSAVTGIQLLAGSAFPLRTHSSFEEAVPWLVETHEQTTNVRLDPDELLKVLQAARQKVG